MIALVFLPALVIGEEEKTAAAANFQAVCDFYAKEIEILEKNKKELKDLVKLESVLYEKLNSSSGICNAIGYLALPDCAMKEEGTKKERVNVFDRLDDKCAEDKTNKITKSLKTVLGLDTEPSGRVVFRSCKDIFVKIILEQFKKMQGFISSQCDQSLSTGPARRKRSYGGGYYPGGYDPSTIWFQYLLCHEQKISCYFFTQGWNEKEFGQYYLYENVLDTDLHSLDHASSGTDDHLLTLLLLGGLGGSHQYPHQGYPSYKKRRDAEDEKVSEDKLTSERRRRSPPTSDEPSERPTSDEPSARRRRSQPTGSQPASDETSARRRRSQPTGSQPASDETSARRRRSQPTGSQPASDETSARRRRSQPTGRQPASDEPSARRRRSQPATNEPSARRRRRNITTKATTSDTEWIECKNEDGLPC